MFMGGVRLRYLILSVLAVAPVAYFFLINSAYRLKRIMSFADPWQYATDEGYQAIHSLMAFGTGGIWGTGVGGGYQKLFYLPEPHTDFIFSVIGEELGLIGVLGVIVCYGVILWRGIGIARSAGGVFMPLVAAGLTFSLGLQVCINMGVALALLPTKGLTLPLLSYGGSSLMVNMACIGLLMNIGAAERNG
jgi:cell division protein FtsW